MEIKMIGNKIAGARKKLNISQAQLAERLFISAQAVGKWERGESLPDIITLNRLAEILGVDLNYFSEDFQSADDKADLRIDPEQAAKEDDGPSRLQEREILMNFSGSRLSNSDFAGVTAHKMKFNGSAMRGADFSGADLTGSSFRGSDVREANFDGTDLTDCILSAVAISDASFSKTILVRTEFSKLALTRVKFTGINLINVKLTRTDLSKTIFENCTFDGVDFLYSDLNGLCFDGMTFVNVRFDKTMLNEVSFKGSTLRNVSLHASYAVTNKYYRGIKTVCFDGATMDKLTYAAIKGLGADLSKVVIV